MTRNLPLFGVAALAVLLITQPVLAGRPAEISGKDHGQKRPGCARVNGNALTEAVADNVFAGTIDDMDFSGVHRPAWVTQTLTDVRITSDGAFKATATTVYEFEGNNDGVCDEDEVCFETTDRVHISGEDVDIDDVDLPKINVQSRVSGGFGEFANACGRLTLHGDVDFSADPTSSGWRVKGRVCSCD